MADAAAVLGLSPSTLRAQVKGGRHPGRRNEQGFWLAAITHERLRESDAALSPRGAAEVLGLKTATVRRHCKQGRYPGAYEDESGWHIPVRELV